MLLQLLKTVERIVNSQNWAWHHSVNDSHSCWCHWFLPLWYYLHRQKHHRTKMREPTGENLYCSSLKLSVFFNRCLTLLLAGRPPAPNVVPNSLNLPNSKTPWVRNLSLPPLLAWPLPILEVTPVWFQVHILLLHKVFKDTFHLTRKLILHVFFRIFISYFHISIDVACLTCFLLICPVFCVPRGHPFVWPVCVCHYRHRCVAPTLWKLPLPD